MLQIPIEILNAILSGECTLFVGAGFSADTPNIIGGSIPIGNKLTAILNAELGLDDEDDDLSIAAQNYERTFGTPKLVHLLKTTFHVSKPNKDQLYILEKPWRSIYTTNYDNVIEACFNGHGISPAITGVNSNPSYFQDRGKLVVHINGAIEDLEENEPIPHSFKLTNVSYATNDFLLSSWHPQLRQDLYTSSYTVFIGCSLKSDLDLQRLIEPSNETGPKTKCVFIVRKGENASIINRLKPYGLVLPVGLEEFVELLKEQENVLFQGFTRRPICFAFIGIQI